MPDLLGFSKLNRWHISALILVLALMGLSILLYLQGSNRSVLQAGTILVLPVKVIGDTAAKSINKYEETDKLIHLLGSSELYSVLDTEDVIEIMNRASISDDVLDIEGILNIFKVSGASLIIETEARVSAKQNRLVYRLHTRGDVDSGDLSGAEINDLFLQLSHLINRRTGTGRLTTNTLDGTKFVNPEIAQALEQIKAGNQNIARSSLEQLLTSDPENVTAKRLLANMLMDSGELTSANRLFNSAIEQANSQGDSRELARLRLSLANNMLSQNEVERALLLLSMAKSDAAKVNDWLYLAYIFERSGQANQRLNRYAAAREQFKKSIYYHKKIHCPYGQVQGQNHLAELELLERNYSKAYRLTKQSLDIITMRDLSNLRAQTLKLHTKIENKL